jgi:phospholipase C
MKRPRSARSRSIGHRAAMTAAALLLASPLVTRARAEHPGGPSTRLTPIDHLVVIFQENVSFDHYFATYPHAANTDGTPFTAKPNTPIINGMFAGGLLDHNPNSTQPFRLRHDQSATCDQDHNYRDEQLAFNAGAMSKFPETVGVGAGGPFPCMDYGYG